MNSKPTKRKVIGTIVIALTINVFVPLINWFTTKITWPLIEKYLETNKLEGIYPANSISTLTSYLTSETNISIFVVELLIIYFIWSLFQRKRAPRIPMNIKNKK